MSSKWWLAPITTGLLLFAAYPALDLNFLIWIGFLPILFFLTRLPPKDQKMRAFLAGLASGLVYFGLTLKWFFKIHPIEWLPIGNELSLALVIATWFICTVVFSAFWGLFGMWAYHLLNRGDSRVNKILGIAGSFIILEYLRAGVFSLIWYGPETIWGSSWTLSNLAYSLHTLPLARALISIIGIYGLSFIILITNLLIFGFVKLGRPPKKYIALGVLLITLTFFSLWGEPSEKPSPTATVAAVTTDFPSRISNVDGFFFERLQRQLALLFQAVSDPRQPEIVVFPEGNELLKTLAGVYTAREAEEFFNNLSPKPILIIDHGRILDETLTLRSRTLYLDSHRGLVESYDKRFLTPLGEYLPTWVQFLVSRFSKELEGNFDLTRKFSKGEQLPNSVVRGNVKIASQICLELIANKKSGFTGPPANLLVFQMSLGVFHGASDLIEQLLAMASVRAAETGKNVLVSMNQGRSGVYGPRGATIALADNKDGGVLITQISTELKITPYSRWGDYPVLVVGLFLVTLPILKRVRR